MALPFGLRSAPKLFRCSGMDFDGNIATKELIPIVVEAAIWGRKWKGKSVQARSDNQAMVATINNWTSRDPAIMHLLHCLLFFEAKFDIVL